MNELAVHLSWHDDARGCFTSRSLSLGESEVINGVRVTLRLFVADQALYPQLVFDRSFTTGDTADDGDAMPRVTGVHRGRDRGLYFTEDQTFVVEHPRRHVRLRRWLGLLA